MKRTLVAAALVVVLSFALVACSGAKPTEEAQKAECTQNMAFIHTEMSLFLADTGQYPPLADVLDKTGKKCPSGGVYAFDPNTEGLSCSIHGLYKP